jgi:dTDP-glucose pyrophosphorylase
MPVGPVADPVGESVVAETATLREAMLALDRGARQIVLAVDPTGQLTGVATDGDLRRSLLAGAPIDGPLAPALSRRFVSVGPLDSRASVLELMRARRIGAIPVVDAEGRPVGLHLLHAFLEPSLRTNWAVIMAGGQGTRLRPLTETVPKPMLKVAGRPILERIVLHLVGHGVKRIFVSVNYLADQIETHFGDGTDFGCRIDYLREDRPLGTAGALGLLPEPPTEPLLVMNGDLVTTADLGGMLDRQVDGGFAATVGVRRYLHSVPFGCVELEDGEIRRWDEKPTMERTVSAGIYALDPRALPYLATGVPSSMPDLIGRLLDGGERVGAYEIEDDWIDVGQRDQLETARGER